MSVMRRPFGSLVQHALGPRFVTTTPAALFELGEGKYLTRQANTRNLVVSSTRKPVNKKRSTAVPVVPARSTHLTSSHWSEPEPYSRTANSSNDPTNQV